MPQHRILLLHLHRYPSQLSVIYIIYQSLMAPTALHQKHMLTQPGLAQTSLLSKRPKTGHERKARCATEHLAKNTGQDKFTAFQLISLNVLY